MLAKHWKKIALLIAIIAILFNVTNKIVRKVPFDKEVKSTIDYVKILEKGEDKKEDENKETTTNSKQSEKYSQTNNEE